MRRSPASFLTTGTKPIHFPRHDLPEVAFAGRSNVGKSSLVNVLAGTRKLVRTSSTPGRTQALNFFLVGELCFVDMPGFGYAKTSHSVRDTFWPMVQAYLKGRENLRVVVLIVDIRRTPGEEEHVIAGLLQELEIPLILAVTKCDKESASHRKPLAAGLEKELHVPAGSAVLVSAPKRIGLDTLWQRIEERCGG